MKYEVLTETDDVYRFTSVHKLSTEEIAEKLCISEDDIVQVDFEDE